MEFTVPRRDLADIVATAARALPVRPPVPVLAGLRISATSEGQLEVVGFDYEVSTRTEAAASVATPGAMLVPGRLLAEITRALPDQPVHLTADATRATLNCGRAHYTLPLLPLDEFPALPQAPAVAGQVDAELWAAAVAQVATAAGRDDTLPVLTGIRVEVEGDRVTLAATDRYRFAVRELLWKPQQDDAPAVALVPAKTLLETSKALASAGSVDLALGTTGGGDGLLGLSGPGLATTTRLLEGEFPKFRALFPTEFTSIATVPTHALADAVKRVALVAERNTPVRLTFTSGQVLLEAGTGDEAQASESIEASFDGDDMQIAFNPQYLLDGIGAIDSDIVRVSFTTPTRPAVITGKGEAQPDYRYVLMPIRSAG
jgi:DNA polymerase-3 subunit beta